MTSENLITVPVGTTLDKAKDILQEYRIEKLLVVDKKGKLAGLITVKDIQKKEDFPNACLDENGRLRVGAAVGVGEDSLERAEALANVNVDIIVIDTAHGHSSGLLANVASIKKKLGDRIGLIAGNVATADAVQALIDVGIDCVKVGIGAGASCTTRVIAGVGVPQLTAVMNCVDAAVNQGIPIIADGCIRYSGDIAKALAY
jgi:IMP dehydrogenase